jgi:hypothetical protein
MQQVNHEAMNSGVHLMATVPQQTVRMSSITEYLPKKKQVVDNCLAVSTSDSHRSEVVPTFNAQMNRCHPPQIGLTEAAITWILWRES